jgi:hypothetical protein
MHLQTASSALVSSGDTSGTNHSQETSLHPFASEGMTPSYTHSARLPTQVEERSHGGASEKDLKLTGSTMRAESASLSSTSICNVCSAVCSTDTAEIERAVQHEGKTRLWRRDDHPRIKVPKSLIGVRTARRTISVLLLLLLLAATCFVPLSSKFPLLAHRSANLQGAASPATAMQDPPSFDSIRLGQWVQTADHQSIEEFASPRQIASPALFTCLMGDGKTTDIPRLLKLSNWQWLPKAHPLAFLAPIDRLLVLERLLQMPEGIVFLGDSLAAEQFSALHAILEGSDPPNALYVRIKQQTTKANGVLMVLQSVLLLHPAGPLYAKLLAEGQHGEKRLQPPVAHLLRCHFLLPDFAEVASLADGNNVTLPLYTWGSDVDYVSVVNSIGEAYDGPSGPELAKTLVVFNTAAHWNPIKLHGMRPDVPAADNVLGAYRRMVGTRRQPFAIPSPWSDHNLPRTLSCHASLRPPPARLPLKPLCPSALRSVLDSASLAKRRHSDRHKVLLRQLRSLGRGVARAAS